MAKVVMVGSPEHVEGERQMARELAQIRASLGDGRRHLDPLGDEGNEALTETDRTRPDATAAQAVRRRVFAMACRHQMPYALTAVEGAVAWSAVAALVSPAAPG